MSTIVRLAGDGAIFPKQCVCCNENSETEVSVHDIYSPQTAVKIGEIKAPACSPCAEHLSKSNKAGANIVRIPGAVLSVVAIIGVLAGRDNIGPICIGGGILVVLTFVATLIVSKTQKPTGLTPNCVLPEDNVVLINPRKKDEVTYTFGNEAYARLFSEGNKGMLLNEGEKVQEKLLDPQGNHIGYRVATTDGKDVAALVDGRYPIEGNSIIK